MVHKSGKNYIKIHVRKPETTFFPLNVREFTANMRRKLNHNLKCGTNIVISNNPVWTEETGIVEFRFTIAEHISPDYEKEMFDSVLQIFQQEITQYVENEVKLCRNFKAEYITVAMVHVDESLTPEERLKKQQDAEKKAALKQLAVRQAEELQKLRQLHERQIAELTRAMEENHAVLSSDN